MEDSFFNIASKVLSKSASGEELAAFEAMLAADAQLRAEYQELEKIWNLSGKTEWRVHAPLDWQKVEQQIMESDALPGRAFFMNATQWMAAAGIVLLMVMGAFFYQQNQWNHTVAGNQNRVIHLPDGSEAHLKAGSELKWKKDFVNNRKLELVGNAYFLVSKNEAVPFMVKSENTTTTVLGTAFLLELKSKDKVKITVTEGKVNFKNKTAGMVLQKDESAISSETVITKERVKVGNELSWVKNELIFNNTPIKEVFEALERHFGLTISVDEDIQLITYSGRYQKPQADDIAKDLEAVLSLRIIKNKREWRVAKP